YDLLRPRLDRFTRMLPGVEAADTAAIHHIRVATRRLRELLPVLQADGRKAAKLADRLRKVNRRVGVVRELDGLLLVVRELRQAGEHSDRALSRMEVFVDGKRAEARSGLVRGSVVPELRRIARQLEAVSDALRDADGGARHAEQWRWAVDA